MDANPESEGKSEEPTLSERIEKAYTNKFTGVTKEDQAQQFIEELKTGWVDVREQETLQLIRIVCKLYKFDAELKKIIKQSYKFEREQYLKTQAEKATEEKEEKEKEKLATQQINVNDEIKEEWEEYELPTVENGYYRINTVGVFRVKESYNETTKERDAKNIDVCRTPFILCGISEPVNDTKIYYKVRFLHVSKEIREFWADQGSLLSRRELKELFNKKGINCPETNLLSEAVDYISRTIAEFGPRFKREYSTKQCGWNEDKTIFILGDRAVTLEGTVPVLSNGVGKGFKELEKTGTLEKWQEDVKDIFEHPVIRFKSYDAMTALLKSILNIESHATDHYGNTSVGKTFSSHVSLSMVGDPDGLTLSAKSTAKGILVTIRDFSDLPLLIDESSDAGEHLADLVYPLTSNKGRVKSTQDGQRDGGEEFHTSIMFTGEKPIRDCLQNAGQQYRVNELDDTLPDLSTKEINKVSASIKQNHGHIIELYLQELFKWKNTDLLQSTYDRCFDILPTNNSNIEGRSRAIFACIMTSGLILEQVFKNIGFPNKNAQEIVKDYYKKCIQEKPVELEYIRALHVVLDWVHSDYGKFAEGSEMREDVSYVDKGKVYGFYDHLYIDIIGTEFTKKMKLENFSPSKIKEDWFKQGISEGNDKKRKGTYRFGRGGKTIVGVRIRRTVAEELLQVQHETPDNIPEDQDGKLKRIFKIIEFLTDLNGTAKINLIRALADVPDLDNLLNIICTNSKKLMKINADEYVFCY